MDELIKYGEIEQLICLENLGDHMFGNVYVKFAKDEEAEKCVLGLRGRYYHGRLVLAEYSPVTSFGEARCRQFDEGHCARGGYCNFMHLRHVPRALKKELHRLSKKFREDNRKRSRSRSRSPNDKKERRRSRSRSPGRADRKGGSGGSGSAGGGKRDRSRSPPSKAKITGSEGDDARRAKIAEWNKKKLEKESKHSGGSGSGSGSGGSGAQPVASTSSAAAGSAAAPPPPPPPPGSSSGNGSFSAAGPPY